jgi:hypothetical protein
MLNIYVLLNSAKPKGPNQQQSEPLSYHEATGTKEMQFHLKSGPLESSSRANFEII